MKVSSSSIAARVVMALVLMIGFYLLAVVIIGLLLYLPYAEMAYAHRIHLKLALLCVLGAGAVFWAILPRFDRFKAPGPRLTRENSPRLFAELESVAGATGQAMPVEVYVVPDVNAWVAERGGLMGFGSRRVMGLGLPLLRTLTVKELGAVLAHEFGHYHSGDTKLGPWIHKTRSAIIRTVRTLANTGSGLVQAPFLWYGKMFLRITHAVSRRQEFVADEIAARTAGSGALFSGLRSIHGTAPAFDAFWHSELAPVLNAGYLPSMADGFARFLEAKPIAEAVAKTVESEMKEGKADPYDTHPPLKERIAAVEHLPVGPGDDKAPAISLLDNVSLLERQLFAAALGDDAIAKLKNLDWQTVGVTVYLPQWTKLVEANEAVLKEFTADSLPDTATALKSLGARLVAQDGSKPDEENQEGFAAAVIGAALTLLLTRAGGTVVCDPGAAVAVRIQAEDVETFSLPAKLAKGEMPRAKWIACCEQLGIKGQVLGAVNSLPPALPALAV